MAYGSCGLRVSEVAALKVEHLDGAGGIPSRRERQGRKTAHILPKPVLDALDALDAHLQGRNGGYIFEGRDLGHISTRQIQGLLDEAA
jgi:integrase